MEVGDVLKQGKAWYVDVGWCGVVVVVVVVVLVVEIGSESREGFRG